MAGLVAPSAAEGLPLLAAGTSDEAATRDGQTGLFSRFTAKRALALAAGAVVLVVASVAAVATARTAGGSVLGFKLGDSKIGMSFQEAYRQDIAQLGKAKAVAVRRRCRLTPC